MTNSFTYPSSSRLPPQGFPRPHDGDSAEERRALGVGSASRYDRRFHFAELSPAYVVTGSRHLSATSPEISKVTSHIGNAEDVVHDLDPMSRVIDPRPLVAPSGSRADIAACQPTWLKVDRFRVRYWGLRLAAFGEPGGDSCRPENDD